MRVSEETINDIRKSANITDVIGHYIPLTKMGKGYRAVCPFHDDHDPSMTISEDKQIYKCFVCGNGGNVFTFVSNFKKISFLESVIEVANVIGKPLDIEYSAPKKENRYQRYFDILNDYVEYTNYLLTATKLGLEAKEYLSKRGIDEEIINEFQIGYNPGDNKVYATLKSKNYSDEDMIKVNIARMGNSGMNDVFYKRITFPIHDKDGNPIAFTARDFTGFSESKYINTAETLIYSKGNVLFNEHRAKANSKQLGSVIVCEGVMDVIAYARAGIRNVVATLGTACTKQQLDLLRNLARTVVLSYDGDRAGKTANMKVGELLLSEGINVEVVDNNTGLDPDEIISKYDKNALRDLSSKKISYLDYAIKYYKEIYNLDNYADRKAMAIKVSKLIDKLTDKDDRENYANELYELTKIRKIAGENRPINPNQKTVYKEYSLSLDGLTKAEYTILMEMVLSVDGKNIYQKELGYLLDEDNGYLANIIIDEYRKHNECRLSRIYDEVDSDKIKNLITTLSTLDSLPDKYDPELLRGSIQRVKEEIKKHKLEDLRGKIAKSEVVDPEMTRKYLKEYSDLLKELGGKQNG
ncbi:MAG: DNA primase [Erysipelotrichaceae bacterium]|nr:DNA primase [Erysipelotrichaceae bacterium]